MKISKLIDKTGNITLPKELPTIIEAEKLKDNQLIDEQMGQKEVCAAQFIKKVVSKSFDNFEMQPIENTTDFVVDSSRNAFSFMLTSKLEQHELKKVTSFNDDFNSVSEPSSLKVSEDDHTFRQPLLAMETTALNFGKRYIQDAGVRSMYASRTSQMSSELNQAVKSGSKTPKEAAKIASQMRNEIMNFARLKTSDIGLAKAKALKSKGMSFEKLVQKYSNKKFDAGFNDLTKTQQNQVMMEIVDSAGRANPQVTSKTARLGAAGRGLWVLSAAIAIYNISSAEDKVDATKREVVGLGGGFAGGAASGAAAGIWFGPVGVAVGVAVGGILGALMADQAYVQIRGEEDEQIQSIISEYTQFFSTDEVGFAAAIHSQMGNNPEKTSKIFSVLARDYTSDVDQIALHYVEEIIKNGGEQKEQLKSNHSLRTQLISILESGYTAENEQEKIDFLKNL